MYSAHGRFAGALMLFLQKVPGRGLLLPRLSQKHPQAINRFWARHTWLRVHILGPFCAEGVGLELFLEILPLWEQYELWAKRAAFLESGMSFPCTFLASSPTLQYWLGYTRYQNRLPTQPLSNASISLWRLSTGPTIHFQSHRWYRYV